MEKSHQPNYDRAIDVRMLIAKPGLGVTPHNDLKQFVKPPVFAVAVKHHAGL